MALPFNLPSRRVTSRSQLRRVSLQVRLRRSVWLRCVSSASFSSESFRSAARCSSMPLRRVCACCSCRCSSACACSMACCIWRRRVSRSVCSPSRLSRSRARSSMLRRALSPSAESAACRVFVCVSASVSSVTACRQSACSCCSFSISPRSFSACASWPAMVLRSVSMRPASADVRFCRFSRCRRRLSD